jgi:hypothetical protein
MSARAGAYSTNVWTNNLQVNSRVTNTNQKYCVPQNLTCSLPLHTKSRRCLQVFCATEVFAISYPYLVMELPTSEVRAVIQL